jgi:hypothetical protein
VSGLLASRQEGLLSRVKKLGGDVGRVGDAREIIIWGGDHSRVQRVGRFLDPNILHVALNAVRHVTRVTASVWLLWSFPIVSSRRRLRPLRQPREGTLMATTLYDHNFGF